MKSRLTTLLAIVMALAMLLSNALTVAAVETPTSPATQPAQLDWGVYLKTHRVSVEITDQIARTRITQVFKNEGERPAEGTYVFPLPPGVTISDLVMFIDGQPIQSKILEKDEARRIYDEIVRRRRDPALLEYIGTNAIQANVFPIPPGDERTLEIEYTQLLTVESGLVNYVYPLRTDHLSPFPVGELSIRVSVESNDPISNIYSPTHRIDINRRSNKSFVAGFETTNAREATDFSLYYGIASDEIDLNLLTFRESANEPGFFLAMISPPFEVDEERVIPKDVIVVLDNSGSMFGNKWDQAREAAKFVLGNLNEEDRFNVVSFSTGIRIFANHLQGVDEVPDARQWLDTIEAIGGTNISEALETALDMNERERQTVILFLTDGLATEGVTDTAEILENFDLKADENISLFAFGVGDDVDTFLLDQLSGDHRGTSAYVHPSENIDEEVANLYNKIRAPLFTNIELDVDGINIYDVYPNERDIPDLFVGTQLVVVGRYQDSAEDVTFRLSGKINDERQTFSYDGLDFRVNAGGEELIPRLWATRRIGELLNAIRLHGEEPELVESIVRLSIRYGIITPYTSFLITEDDIFTQTGRNRAFEEAQDATFGLNDEASGPNAVEAAEASRDLADADMPAAPPTVTFRSSTPGDAGGGVGFANGTEGEFEPNEEFAGGEAGPAPLQLVGDRTFVQRDGKWIDTSYDADTMELRQLVFLSDEYFELLDQDERVAEFYALGESVIFVLDGQAYEIVPEATE